MSGPTLPAPTSPRLMLRVSGAEPVDQLPHRPQYTHTHTQTRTGTDTKKESSSLGNRGLRVQGIGHAAQALSGLPNPLMIIGWCCPASMQAVSGRTSARSTAGMSRFLRRLVDGSFFTFHRVSVPDWFRSSIRFRQPDGWFWSRLVDQARALASDPPRCSIVRNPFRFLHHVPRDVETIVTSRANPRRSH